jgi:hypothetical protein
MDLDLNEMFGEDAASAEEMISAITWIMAKHWGRIRQAAQDPELGGIIGVSLSTSMNFTGPAPKGDVGISYAIRRKDNLEWHGHDPRQENLPGLASKLVEKCGGGAAGLAAAKGLVDVARKMKADGVTITVMDGIEPGSRISAGDPEEVPIEKKNARKR